MNPEQECTDGSPDRYLHRIALQIAEKALRHFGKTYHLESGIPLALIVHVMCQRTIWLIRGLLRLRAISFIGPRVRIRGKSHLAIGKGVTIGEGVKLDCYGVRGIVLGDRSKIGAMSVVSVTSHLSRVGLGVHLGRDSAFGEFSYVGGSGGVHIGDDVIIGQFVSFHSQDHVFSTCDRLIREQGTTEQGILIGNDCWVGARVSFLDGAVVGDHSVVAAGAVVKGVFPPHSVIGGVPARQLRSRKD